MNITIAAKKKFAVTPASRRTPVGNSPCRDLTRLNTRKMAPKDPKNAKKGITGNPNNATCKFKAMAITAPRAAPLETPSVKGAAKSFLNKA